MVKARAKAGMAEEHTFSATCFQQSSVVIFTRKSSRVAASIDHCYRGHASHVSTSEPLPTATRPDRLILICRKRPFHLSSLRPRC
eukprot:6184976-Pleurochrysis_carterae.AAC.2